MRKTLPVFLLCLIGFFKAGQAQNQSKIDSLKQVLEKTIDDTSKVNIMVTLSREILQHGDYEPAEKYADDALALSKSLHTGGKQGWKKGEANAYGTLGVIYSLQGNDTAALRILAVCLDLKKEMGDKKGIAATYVNIGTIYQQQSNYAEALKNHSAAAKIGEEIGDKKTIAYAHNNIGGIYEEMGNYPEALKNFLITLKISEEIGDKPGIAFGYNNVGNIYDDQSNYPEALKNYFAALKIREELGDKRGISHCYSNIANVYQEQGNYPEALKYCLECIKIAEEIGDDYIIAFSYQIMGSIYENQGDYQEALKNYMASLKIREEMESLEGIASASVNIGKTYAKLKKFPEALQYLNKGLAVAKEIDVKYRIQDAYAGLAAAAVAMNDFKKAYEYEVLYTAIKDSVLNEESNSHLSQMEAQYEYDKKEIAFKAEQDKKDAVAKAELRDQKIQKYYLIAVALLLLAAAGFFIRNVQNKRKLDAQIARMEKKNEIESIRNKISLDIHDDIGSGLSKIAMLLNQFKSKTASLGGSEVEELVNKITGKSREVISGLGEIVWTANPNHDNLKSLLGFMRQYISKFFEDTNIRASIDFPEELADMKIHPEVKRNLFLVLKESLNNVMKHSGATEVNIRFEHAGGKFTMKITDNGKGIDEKLLTAFGTGLRSMRQRVEEIKGKFKLDSSPGQGTNILLEGILY